MAGLRDELELDVTGALRDIDRLGAALTQVAQKFRKDMAAALDTLRLPTAGTSRGDRGVLDRSGQRQPRQAAPMAPAVVQTQGLDEAARKTRKVTEEQHRLKRATEGTTAATGKYGATLQGIAQIRVVQGLVAFFGGRALVTQIGKTADAYADLLQETARSEQVFQGADRAILSFADSAVTQVGLARREAIKAANDFGTMFVGAGLGEQQAAQLSQTFVRLGADISAFSNIGVPEALVKLQAGLAGEQEALRRIGFGFNAAEVEAKALSMQLETVNGELTTSARTMALAAVIQEKAGIATGQYAREQDGLIGQQARLRAESEQIREEIGERLQPIMLEMTTAIRDQLPALAELATNLIPVLVSAMQTAAPIAIALLNAFTAFTPVISAFGSLLNAIPAPILSVAAAFIFLNSGLGPLPNTFGRIFTAMKEGLATMPASSSRLKEMGAAFGFINPYAVAATVAVIGFTSILAAHRREQEKTKAAIKEATAAFLDQADSVNVDANNIAEKALQGGSDDLIGRLTRDLGLTISEFADLAAKGNAGFLELREIINNAGMGREERIPAERDFASALRETTMKMNEAAKAAIDLQVARGNLKPRDVAKQEKDNQFEDTDESMYAAAQSGTNYFAVLEALDPALAKVLKGQQDVAGSTTEVATGMDALEDALSGVKDALDETFGRFLDAEEAVTTVRDAVGDLAGEMAKGAEDGETAAGYQERLAGGMRDVAQAVEDYAFAQARAGKIGRDQASIQNEIRGQLILLRDTFPGLRTQIDSYIALLGTTPPTVTTKARFDDVEARAAVTGWFGFVQRAAALARSLMGQANDPKSGEHQARHGQNAAPPRPADTVIPIDLDGAAANGASMGRAAADAAKDEIETTLRLSGTGYNIGGFLVDGIILGAKEGEVAIANWVNGMTDGLQGVVHEAMKIDPTEAGEILNAVAAMDQALLDLNEAVEKFGANSIEAAIAQNELAASQEEVNELILEATNSTEAYSEALDKVTDSIDVMTGSLRALQSLKDAQKAAREATEDLDDEQKRLALFDRLIKEGEAKVAAARAARPPGAGETLEERRATASLLDLRARRSEQAGVVADAEGEVVETQLGLVDSLAQMVELGGQVGGAEAHWVGFFRNLATAAGMTEEAVNNLVTLITDAGTLAQNTRTGVLTGTAQAAVLPVQNIGTQTIAAAATKIMNNNFYITESGSGRTTALSVVDEIRAVELVG